MVSDPLFIRAEQMVIDQADQLIFLVGSNKFAKRSSLILCRLDRLRTIITDDNISQHDAKMVEQAGVNTVIAETVSNGVLGSMTIA